MAMTSEDPRQDEQFAAAWTIGYAAATGEGRLDLLTLGTLTGPLGLIGETGPRPVFRAAQDLAAMTGATRLACRSSAPDRVAGLAIRHDRRTILLVANLTPTEQLATIGGSGPVGARSAPTSDGRKGRRSRSAAKARCGSCSIPPGRPSRRSSCSRARTSR